MKVNDLYGWDAFSKRWLFLGYTEHKNVYSLRKCDCYSIRKDGTMFTLLPDVPLCIRYE